MADKKGRGNRNGVVALALAGVAFGMVGAAFASVPLYQWFCKTTGFGGTTQVAKAAPAVASNRSFVVDFDANVKGDLAWRFHPDQTSITVRAGEVATVTYTIENLTDRTISASAAYHVNPDLAGAYFDKIVCFCFNAQTLQPHEKVTLPVTFFVDPAIDNERSMRGVEALTLSYTFFELPPDATAGLPVRSGSEATAAPKS